jgi:hypothetical protein
MFVNTVPEAIAAAAAQLEGIGNSFSAESSAAAAPTTTIAPAASDEVSTLQSGVFSTYGQLYQAVSAQAQAIHQQFVKLLQTTSGSYGATEAANQVAAASTPLSSAASSSASTSAQSGGGLANVINNLATFLGNPSGLSSGYVSIPMDEMGNFASAYSDVIGIGGGGMLLRWPVLKPTSAACQPDWPARLPRRRLPVPPVLPGLRAWAQRRYWPGSVRHRRSAPCRCRPAGPPESRRRARP